MANLATINDNILADSGIDPINLIVGTGTINYIPKFTAEGSIGNSIMTESGANILISSNIVLHAGNYNSYAPTLTGTGASGTWGINISGNASYATSAGNADTVDGLHAAAFALAGGSNAIGTWPISITGSASSATAASTANLVIGNSGGAIQSWDIRTIAPSSMVAFRMGFGFTSWANNNTAPYADYLHLRSYSDASGGSDNLVMFLKSGIGMRIYQQAWGSSAPYTTYVDMLDSGNFNTWAPTKTGGGASGTWGISITGNADTVDGLHASAFALTGGSNATGTWGISISGNAATVTNGVYTSRTLTINGVTYDLSANRSWTIAAGVTAILAGPGISVNQAQGDVTISNTGVLSVNGSTGAVTGIATTAQLAGYLPLTGGTLTGQLNVHYTNGRVSIGNGTDNILIGAWDGVNQRIESNTRPIYIISYGGLVNLGRAGGNTLALDTTSLTWGGAEIATQPWVQSQGYVTGGPFLPLAGGTMTGSMSMGNFSINNVGVLQHVNGRIILYGNLHLDSFNGNAIYLQYYNQGVTTRIYGDIDMNNYNTTNVNIGYANNSFRAPVFYDSQDTSYYIDPNGTSIVHTINGVNMRVSNAYYWGGGNVYMNYNSRIGSNVGIYSDIDMMAPIYYDGNDTAFYGNFASTSRFYITRHEAISDTSYVRITNPGGGYLVNNGPITASIKIKIPIAASYTNTMLSFTVQIYNYQTGTSRTIRCAGYTYGATQSWYNISAYQIGDNNAENLFVRFGKDATGACVWIGETSTAWYYPNIFITDVQSGHSQPTTMATGWVVSLVTSFDTVEDSRVAYYQINAGNISSQSVASAAYATNAGALDGLDSSYFASAASLANYVPVTRTLTINGVTYDLSANRSWTIASGGVNSIIAGAGISVNQAQGDVTISNTGVLSVNGSTGAVTGIATTAQLANYLPLAGGTVTGVTNFTATVNLQASTWFGGYGPGSGAGIAMENLGTFARLAFWGLDFYDWNHGMQMTIDNGYVSATNSFRAPIFYDSQDTGYYVDPNSTSNISKVQVGATAEILGLVTMGSGYLYGMGITSAYTTVYGHASGNGVQFGFYNGTTFTWKLRVNNDGSTVAAGSMMAPIFYDSDNGAYYGNFAGTSNLATLYAYSYQGNGNVAGTGSASYHPSGIYSTGTNWLYGTLYMAGNNQRDLGGIVQNNIMGRPNAQWGASSATGAVVIKFPGNTNNYGMVHAVIDIYEYNGNNVSTIIIGGHNWGSQWYSYGANVVGYTNKLVRVGVKDGQYCIIIGDSSASWSYGQVVLRKIQNGAYYSGVMDVGAGYTINIESDTYSWVSPDLRTLRSSGPIYMNEALVATQSWVNSQGYVTGGPFLPLAGGQNMSGSFGLSDSKLYLRTNGDNNHYLWNAADDWEELNAYEGTGFRVTSNGGSNPLLYVYGTNSGGYTYSPYSFRAPIFYDSQDTSYYGDFNNQSRFAALKIGNQGTFNSGTSYALQISSSTRYQIALCLNNASDYPWLATDSWGGYNALIFHFNGYGDMFFFNRAGNMRAVGSIESTSFIGTATNSSALNGWGYTSYAYRASGSGYYQITDWIQLYGGYGLYWPNNYGLHIYPNTAAYGALQINGSKNGWAGIFFSDSGTTLMMNSNESGHYRDGYGWQYRWYNGGFYITTAAQGGGSEYLALHTGNYNSYAPTLTGGNASGTWAISITGGAGYVTWNNVSSKPAEWLNAPNLIHDSPPSATAVPSGFYQSYQGAGNPTGTWFNYINVRHSNTSNGHGYQIGMSYYDNNLWFRSYQGSTSPTFGPWSRALGTATDPYASNMNQYVRTSDNVTFFGTLSLSADNGADYTASRIWLYSHADYRGSGVYMSLNGGSSTWYAGTPYTNFTGVYMIGNVALTGNPSAAAPANMRWQVNTAGSTTQTGTATATGFFESSDARLKTIVDENYRVDSIVAIKPKFYQKNGKFEAGYIAQEVQGVYEHAVILGIDDYLNLSYTQIHTLKIATLEDSVDQIKQKIQELEQKLNSLY